MCPRMPQRCHNNGSRGGVIMSKRVGVEVSIAISEAVGLARAFDETVITD